MSIGYLNGFGGCALQGAWIDIYESFGRKTAIITRLICF